MMIIDFSPSNTNTNIPSLFSVSNRAVPSSGLTLEPFYIWVEEEGQGEDQEQDQDHALRLLNEYKAREAVQQVEGGGRAGKKGSSGVDQYERSVPSHGDQYFHHFLSVIKKHPAQILRYDRLSGSGPLLLR